MARSLTTKQIALSAQAGELLFAAPVVMAHRLARMAVGKPGAKGRLELRRMGIEKAQASQESFNAVAAQVMRSTQNATTSYANAWWRAWMQLFLPWLAPGGRARFPMWGATSGQMQHAAMDVMAKAMAPVHRRTVANAKRLSKRRR